MTRAARKAKDRVMRLGRRIMKVILAAEAASAIPQNKKGRLLAKPAHEGYEAKD
jgi:hypothetical protein